MHTLAKIIITALMFCLLQPTVVAALGKGIDKNQAVKAVKRQYPGKIIKISSSNEHYKVRLLQKNGRVVNLKVDKNSGKVMSPGRKSKGKNKAKNKAKNRGRGR